LLLYAQPPCHLDLVAPGVKPLASGFHKIQSMNFKITCTELHLDLLFWFLLEIKQKSSFQFITAQSLCHSTCCHNANVAPWSTGVCEGYNMLCFISSKNKQNSRKKMCFSEILLYWWTRSQKPDTLIWRCLLRFKYGYYWFMGETFETL
jgi:hypothetical protein